MKTLTEWSRHLLAGIGVFGVALALGPLQLQAVQQLGPGAQTAAQPPSAPLAPDQLQQLVAPIALYPDALVAQILAASTYPTQIVEAERFLQQNPNLTGAALGARAPGGSQSYLVNGKMTHGFAFLAYPAEYRSSGVMTFLVGQDGIVYEKDLCRKTDEVAKSLQRYARDGTWRKAD